MTTVIISMWIVINALSLPFVLFYSVRWFYTKYKHLKMLDRDTWWEFENEMQDNCSVPFGIVIGINGIAIFIIMVYYMNILIK